MSQDNPEQTQPDDLTSSPEASEQTDFQEPGSEVKTHRYEKGAIIKDYAMGGIGLGVVTFPLVMTDLGVWMTTFFGGFSALFAIYMVRTWIRSATVILIDDIGIRAQGPRSAALPWSDLGELELRYFSTRRDRNGGWMQLTLGEDRKTGKTRIAIESTLEDFEGLALAAGAAAERNGLALSETTKDNLTALATTGMPSSSVVLEPGLRAGRPKRGDGPRDGTGRGGF